MQRVRLPVSLLIGVVFGWFGVVVYAWSGIIATVSKDVDFKNIMRWEMFGFAASIAGALLVASALFGLANRLSGFHRTLLLIAAWLSVVVAAWDVVRPFIDMAQPRESYREMLDIVWRAISALNVVSMIAIGIATRAWNRSPLTMVAAIVAILAALFGTWLPYFGTWLFETLYEDHRMAFQLFFPFRDLLWNGALLVMVAAMLRDSGPALPDERVAGIGFRTAAGALIGRVLAALALALMGMGMIKSMGAVKMMLLIAPAITVGTSLVFVWGVLTAERGNLEGLPRIRMCLGAAITAWCAGVQILQTTWGRTEFLDDTSDQWTILAPIIGTVGMGLVMSAIHRFAVVRNNERLRQAATSRATLFIVMSVIAMAAPLMLLGARDAGAVVIIVVLAAVCGIVGLIAIAGLMSVAADTLGSAPQLPEARLHK